MPVEGLTLRNVAFDGLGQGEGRDLLFRHDAQGRTLPDPLVAILTLTWLRWMA
ncbi:MAG TPA: hypothetical protein VGC99_27030 [Candidatus Tectomicrobia bacterium]